MEASTPDVEDWALETLEEFHGWSVTDETSLMHSLVLSGFAIRCDRRTVAMLHQLVLANAFPRNISVLVPDGENRPYAVGFSHFNPDGPQQCGGCNDCHPTLGDVSPDRIYAADNPCHITRALSLFEIESEGSECYGCRHDHWECEYRIDCYRLNDDAIQRAWNDNIGKMSAVELPESRVVYAFPKGYGWENVDIIGDELCVEIW